MTVQTQITESGMACLDALALGAKKITLAQFIESYKQHATKSSDYVAMVGKLMNIPVQNICSENDCDAFLGIDKEMYTKLIENDVVLKNELVKALYQIAYSRDEENNRIRNKDIIAAGAQTSLSEIPEHSEQITMLREMFFGISVAKQATNGMASNAYVLESIKLDARQTLQEATKQQLKTVSKILKTKAQQRQLIDLSGNALNKKSI